jgi:hypothetical protein
MRNFTKSLLALALLFVCVIGAKADGDKTYWTPSSAYGANWNAVTKTMSWTKNDNGWYILYTGFTPAVQNNENEIDLLEKYTKIHIGITSITGADNLQLKIKSKNKAEKTIILTAGETDIVFADYSDVDFAKVLEITLWGTLSGSNENGSAVIDECYLLTNDRWEYQTQQQTVYTRGLGDALELSSVVTNGSLVSIAADGGIIFGAYDITDGTGNQIHFASLDDAFAKIDAAEAGKATYRYKITEATTTTDAGLVLPSGVTAVYCIQAFDGNGNLYRGPYWQDGYLDDLGWCTSVNKGDNGAAFFAFTPVAGKTNTYKITSYKKDGTLQSENYQGKTEWILNVIGETPKQVDVEVLVEVQGADTEDPGVPAVPDGWVSLITNGDLSGNDVTSFWTKNEDGGAIAAVINESAGRMNGRGIKVTTKDEAGTDWGTQFFIKSSEPLKEGQKLHIEFDYRADRPQEAATQVHRNPGDYNANIDAINFTVNWKHYSNEITITSAMCKQDGGTGDFYLQSFGMNLSHIRSTSNFYFDNIVMWTEDDPLKPQKIALQKAIDKGNLQNSFAKTTDSWNDLQTTISNGVAELANASTTAELLTNAADAIENAIAGLKLQDGYTNLTADMLRKWDNNNTPTTSTAVTGAYVLNESTGQPYGESTVDYLNFADISDFNKLYLLIAAGTARIQMNRETAGGTTHVVTSSNAVTEVDFATEPQLAGFDFVHLNAIKDNWSGVTVTGMYLYRTVTVTTAGFASFGSLFKNAKLKGTTTYAAKYSAGKLTLTEVTNVPAGKGVIVEAAEGSYPPTFDVAAEDIDSDLKVSNGTVVGDGSQFFALAKKDDKVGFAKVKSGVKIPAGKAYLFVEGGFARDFIGFDDETTGIEAVEQATKADNQYFNLAGQRVAQPTKGLYIVNGKKVIIK